jgi:hypothetical protein
MLPRLMVSVQAKSRRWTGGYCLCESSQHVLYLLLGTSVAGRGAWFNMKSIFELSHNLEYTRCGCQCTQVAWCDRKGSMG